MSHKIGPVIIDLIGKELSSEEQELIQHPLVGGIIFFTRNYESPAQIMALCKAIRKTKKTPILITIDQEGGRVQRFREGFIELPSMGKIGELYLQTPEKGIHFASICGWLMASELLHVGIDLSFAPVLDMDLENNPVVGDRAFARDPQVISALANAFILGMREAGMASVGKHFPGHGSVSVDSHLDMPVDLRSFNEIESNDLIPFNDMISAGIEGIMAAHIQFPQVDSLPVGFSARWLQEILRKKLNFSGMIFSDCLNMEGAKIAGGFPDRVEAALQAGCDMTLVCNNREGAIKTLDGLNQRTKLVELDKYSRLLGNFSQTLLVEKTNSLRVNKLALFNEYMEKNQSLNSI